MNPLTSAWNSLKGLLVNFDQTVWLTYQQRKWSPFIFADQVNDLCGVQSCTKLLYLTFMTSLHPCNTLIRDIMKARGWAAVTWACWRLYQDFNAVLRDLPCVLFVCLQAFHWDYCIIHPVGMVFSTFNPSCSSFSVSALVNLQVNSHKHKKTMNIYLEGPARTSVLWDHQSSTVLSWAVSEFFVFVLDLLFGLWLSWMKSLLYTWAHLSPRCVSVQRFEIGSGVWWVAHLEPVFGQRITKCMFFSLSHGPVTQSCRRLGEPHRWGRQENTWRSCDWTSVVSSVMQTMVKA